MGGAADWSETVPVGVAQCGEENRYKDLLHPDKDLGVGRTAPVAVTMRRGS